MTDGSSVRPWSEGNAAGAFLTGFEAGSTELESSHHDWLRSFSHRFPGMSGDLYVVALIGPSAGEGASRELAERRALSVYRFLREAARSLPWIGVHVGAVRVGSGDSPREQAARHRAVAVVHVTRGHVPHWLRGSLQRGPLPSNIFFLRPVVGRALGAPEEGGAVAGTLDAAGEEPPGAAGLRLEIGDGRWSLTYRVAPASSSQKAEDGGTAGPWHSFSSPFELTVDEFRGTRVRLSSRSWDRPGVRLKIARPPVTLDPFVSDLVLDPGESGLGGRLQAEGRSPREHVIPASIRAHLRRRGQPGPGSRE